MVVTSEEKKAFPSDHTFYKAVDNPTAILTNNLQKPSRSIDTQMISPSFKPHDSQK
jgi:hypothetical protein